MSGPDEGLPAPIDPATAAAYAAQADLPPARDDDYTPDAMDADQAAELAENEGLQP